MLEEFVTRALNSSEEKHERKGRYVHLLPFQSVSFARASGIHDSLCIEATRGRLQQKRAVRRIPAGGRPTDGQCRQVSLGDGGRHVDGDVCQYVHCYKFRDKHY